jgi:hypothetical protein
MAFKTTSYGKGDKPRNISKLFHQNFDMIEWGNKNKPSKKVSSKSTEESKNPS